MSDDYSKMIAPRADEELHDGRESPVVMHLDPKDRLPARVAQANFDTPPGLSPENLVCMADTSSFVTRDDRGEIRYTFRPDQVVRGQNGLYYYLPEDNSQSRVGLLVIDRFAIEVEPVRPACKHYLRQMTDISTNRESRFIQRSCLAQRSETGEYVSLRDSALYACTLRSPPHIASEKLLDDFDAGKMAEERKRQEMASFDIDAELAGASLGVLSPQ